MPALGAWSYGAAAAFYLGLSLLLVVAWEGRGQGIRLIAATVATALWAAILAIFAIQDTAPPLAIFVVETLRLAAWLVVLAGLVAGGRFPVWLARASYAAWIGALAGAALIIGFAPWMFPEFALAAGLLLPLLGLVMLEQVYRNSNTSGRWALKFLYIGLGGMLVFDVFMYSQGLLLKSISPDAWYARGAVLALTVPFMAIAARRNPQWSVKVFISRDVAFYTSSFMAVGAYLLLMAAGGYLVRLLGGVWGDFAQIVFLAGAVALLAVLVGSSTLRRRLKVFLVKHFYKHKYEYREEWLRFIATLSAAAPGEGPRETALRAVAQIIGSPAAALIATGPGREVTAWPVELPVPAGLGQLAGNPQLLDLLARREWVIDLAEYREDPDAYEQLPLPAELLGRGEWRLIVPVMLQERLFGMLLLKEPPQGFSLTFEDRDLLKTVARHIATHLAQHESEQRLAEARQFEAYNRLTAFLMHDLKNAVAQLELIGLNASRHRENPEFINDALETVANTSARISRLIEQLQSGIEDSAAERVDLPVLLQRAAERSASREPRPMLPEELPDISVRANADRLGHVLEHVIRNAQDATPAQGQVTLAARKLDGRAIIEVRDSGRGMDAEFIRERLFRPFDGTKGSKGMGIGAYQAREYARSLGGDVEVESSPEQGTTFRIILPIEAGDG